MVGMERSEDRTAIIIISPCALLTSSYGVSSEGASNPLSTLATKTLVHCLSSSTSLPTFSTRGHAAIP